MQGELQFSVAMSGNLSVGIATVSAKLHSSSANSSSSALNEHFLIHSSGIDLAP